MKPTEDKINDAMCKVSFPFSPGMTRGETEWKVKQFVAELFNIVGARPTTPKGWRLVPVEPTEGMIEGMRTGSRRDWPSDELCRVRYVAMLAAAPKFGEEE